MLRLHRPGIGRRERWEEMCRVLEVVGLRPGTEYIHKYPYEMSGGQRQRIGFAQALLSRPKVILADEPVSMLDVSIRVDLLNLMRELRDHDDVSILYITHDIASARYIADRVVVMYAGRIVEQGPVEVVLGEARHPYTRLLLEAVGGEPEGPVRMAGTVEGLPTAGCAFFPRCGLRIDVCRELVPGLEVVRRDHCVACHVEGRGVAGSGEEHGEERWL
jgi:peptide/nickel transport system ATP-binding protein